MAAKKLITTDAPPTPMKEVEHTETYTCNFCGAKYKTRAGLWKHLKVCEYAPSEEEEEEPVEETGGISIFNDEGDEEEDEPQFDQRRGVKIADRLSELIGDGRRNRRAGRKQ